METEKIIIVTTDFELRSLEKIDNLNPSKIVEELLEGGYDDFILIDPHIKQFAGEIRLHVENDIKFFVEDYLSLEELFLQKKAFEHKTFYGDGVLKTNAKVNDFKVELTYKYYPHLRADNLITHETTTTKEKYLMWWRNAAYKLAKIRADL